MVSANNGLIGGSSRAKDIALAAGPGYETECAEVAGSFGSDGIPQGRAVVTGGYRLAQGNLRRRIIQAITIAYHNGARVKATPEIVYRAARAGLELAETYHIASISTYLMAARYPCYATRQEAEMAEALCRAVIDHAGIAVSINRVVICERRPPAVPIDRVSLAASALMKAYAARYAGPG